MIQCEIKQTIFKIVIYNILLNNRLEGYTAYESINSIFSLQLMGLQVIIFLAF